MEYELNKFPADFSGEVRLFPLPNLVLYPGCVQPLHIFESRYCEMLEDAMHDDCLLAIATLMPGYEVDYYSRPPVADHICVGQVIMHDKSPNGTYNLVLVGARRAEIKHEVTPVRSYRRASVEIIDDLQVTDTRWARQMGDELAERVMAASESAEELAMIFREGKISLSSLTDIIAFYFPLEIALKIRLLKEPDPLARGNLLLKSINFDSPKSTGQPKHPPFKDDSNSERRRFPPLFGDN